MLRLGNSTIDSTKSFKVPQPSQEPPQTGASGAATRVSIPMVKMVPHVVSVKNTYFDHDRKYGPTFEDASGGNVTKITVQLGEDAHLNCRIKLLTVGAVTYAADNRVTVARRYPGNWKLLIREVKPDDEGVYECQISTHPPRTEQVPGGADSLLRLARVNSSDAGNYTCAVRGARSHTVSVHVL
ncbi:Uncharacterized protein OBRU01_05283, partial [Operophtera brumata]